MSYVEKDLGVSISQIGEPGYNESKWPQQDLPKEIGETIVEKFEVTDLYAKSPYVGIHVIGGGGGSAFCYYGGSDGSLLEKIGVWVGGWQVKAVKIWRTNGMNHVFGKPSGPYKEYKFTPGELITSMSLWGNGAGTRLGAIKFRTDKGGDFFAKMTSWGLKQEYPIDVGSGACVGVIGRSGDDIDNMGFIFVKPLRSSEMLDVNYPTIGSEKAKVQMTNLKSVNYDNHHNTKQTYTLEVSETLTKTENWEVTAGLEATVSTEVTAGIPEVASSTTGFSLTVSVSGSYGMSTTTTKNEKWTFPIIVPAKANAVATVSMGKANINLPYNARIVMTTTDGSTLQFRVNGIYKGVSYTKVFVKVKSI